MKTTILAKSLLAALFSSLLIGYSPLCFALEISPKTINLGDIKKNTIIKQEITINNNEAKAVILEKARSSCGCLTLEYKKNTQLKKNQTCKIIIKLNTAELSEGKLKKFIFLYFRNAESPIYSIEVRGNILPF